MEAVAFEEYGGPQRLALREVPRPEVGEGQVRVRVGATTVNPADVQFLRGDHDAFVGGAEWPRWGGLEFVGTVDAVGAGVGFAVGDRVLGTTHFIPGGRGSHAELVAVDASWVVACPPELSDVVAATLPMNALTARVVLESLPPAAAGPVVVAGAAGAVGSFVVELAAAQGYEVVAVASPGDEEWLRTRGACGFVVRGDDLAARLGVTVSSGVSAVVDAAKLGAEVLPAVSDGGSFLVLRPGHVPPPERGIEPRLVSFRRHQARPDVLGELVRTAVDGGLTPRVAATYAPGDAPRAYVEAARRGLRGRVVLDWSADPSGRVASDH